MTETRGRALLISNEYKLPNGSYRKGSEHDYRNMRDLLVKLGFVVVGGHQNYTAKEMVEAIHRETQLVDETGESVYKNLGVFVLMITSHGTEGCVAGVDGKLVKLSDISKMVSARNFPAMLGKPKLLVIQACAGSSREMLLDTTDSVPSISELSAAAPEPLPPTSDLEVTSSAPREGDLYQTGSDVIQLFYMK